MSQKNGRRHRRRNEEENLMQEWLEFKLPAQHKKQIPAAVPIEEQQNNTIPTQKKQSVDAGEVFQVVHDVDAIAEANGNGNGNGQEIECDIELPADNEVELELQFDENSDADSCKESPQRCMTRRSQTRNIPTPKTPKSFIEHNGEEKEENGATTKDSENNSQDEVPPSGSATPVDSCPTPIPFIDLEQNTPTETDSQSKTEDEHLKTQDEQPKTDDNTQQQQMNISIESTESTVSTKVNVGSDNTREADLTLPDDKDSFVNAAKDMSVVESLRRISSRRGIRGGVTDYRKSLLKSQTENYAQRSSLDKGAAGVKRKTRSQTPEDNKRFKGDSPGFLSYLTSPVNKIKNLFATPTVASSSETVSASTPKLTSYKQQELVEDPELSKIEDAPKTIDATKKGCIIM